VNSTEYALHQGWIDKEQALTAEFKHPMLNPTAMVWESCIIFAILLLFMFLLNRWSLSATPIRRQGRTPVTSAGAPLREPERAGHSGLRHRHDRGGNHLDQVAGRDLVLVDMGIAVPGGAGLRGAGAGHPERDSAVALPADEDAAAAPPSSTIWASWPSPL